VAHCIYPSVNPVQATGPYPPSDGTAAQSGRLKLPDGYDTVLSAGYMGDRHVTCGALRSHTDRKAPQARVPPRVGSGGLSLELVEPVGEAGDGAAGFLCRTLGTALQLLLLAGQAGLGDAELVDQMESSVETSSTDCWVAASSAELFALKASIKAITP